MDTCKSCKAPIRWVVTQKNKRMPIDPEPSKNGNIQLVDQGKYYPPLAIIHSVRAPGAEYFISHFVTCPEAARHRKKHRDKELPNPVLRGAFDGDPADYGDGSPD